MRAYSWSSRRASANMSFTLSMSISSLDVHSPRFTRTRNRFDVGINVRMARFARSVKDEAAFMLAMILLYFDENNKKRC